AQQLESLKVLDIRERELPNGLLLAVRVGGSHRAVARNTEALILAARVTILIGRRNTRGSCYLADVGRAAGSDQIPVHAQVGRAVREPVEGKWNRRDLPCAGTDRCCDAACWRDGGEVAAGVEGHGTSDGRGDAAGEVGRRQCDGIAPR